MKDKKHVAIERAMMGHQNWLSRWARSSGFTVQMCSPSGKWMTTSAYQMEVRKHLNKTIKKILSIAHDEATLKANQQGE